MPFFRYFALFLLLAVAILLTGALSSQPADTARAALSPEVCTAAVNALDEAITRLDLGHVAWLETTVWQKACFDQFTYQAEGRYLAGPDNRFRLELTTRQGNGTAIYLVVGDGKSTWEGTRFGDGSWRRVTRRSEQQGFRGVLPLLHALRSCMTWTRRETVRRQGRIFIKLTGPLLDSTADPLARPDQPLLHCPARESRLYLDAETLWPHRVEWWGRSSSQSGDALLMQMEFRDPHFNSPLSAERCAAEFSIPHAAK
jgi:hypothetical protein